MITDSEISALRNEFVRKENLHEIIAQAVRETLAALALQEAQAIVSAGTKVINVAQESANASKN